MRIQTSFSEKLNSLAAKCIPRYARKYKASDETITYAISTTRWSWVLESPRLPMQLSLPRVAVRRLEGATGPTRVKGSDAAMGYAGEMGRSRVVVISLASLVFGVGLGTLKGNSGGVRDGFGNLSSPWLILAIFAGAAATGVLGGALMGTLATGIALFGFYGITTAMLGADLGGNGFLGNLILELQLNKFYFVAGLMSGPIFGALGRWIWLRNASLLTPLVGLLMVGEFLAVLVVQGRQLPLFSPGVWWVSTWLPYIGQALLGALIATVGLVSWIRNWKSQRPRPDAMRAE